MTQPMNDLEAMSLPLPLTQAAQMQAHRFASQQPPQTADRVRRNTLAVCIVKDYLELMGIDTNASASASWDPVSCLCADVADLVIPNVGVLECRPLTGPLTGTCDVPPETWHDRIGYAVVQLDEAEQEATLLGFVPTAGESIALSQLRSPEDLLAHIDQIRQTQVSPVSAAVTAIGTTVETSITRLSQWFQDHIEASWQTLDALLNPQEFGYATRQRRDLEALASSAPAGTVRRAQMTNWGERSVLLTVEISPTANQQTHIHLKVFPAGDSVYLRPQVRLDVLDEAGAPFLAARSEMTDNYIQLQFSGDPGERFSVLLAYEELTMIAEFLI
jgi:Protein of unknown function (DUF1822)